MINYFINSVVSNKVASIEKIDNITYKILLTVFSYYFSWKNGKNIKNIANW